MHLRWRSCCRTPSTPTSATSPGSGRWGRDGGGGDGVVGGKKGRSEGDRIPRLHRAARRPPPPQRACRCCPHRDARSCPCPPSAPLLGGRCDGLVKPSPTPLRFPSGRERTRALNARHRAAGRRRIEARETPRTVFSLNGFQAGAPSRRRRRTKLSDLMWLNPSPAGFGATRQGRQALGQPLPPKPRPTPPHLTPETHTPPRPTLLVPTCPGGRRPGPTAPRRRRRPLRFALLKWPSSEAAHGGGTMLQHPCQ